MRKVPIYRLLIIFFRYSIDTSTKDGILTNVFLKHSPTKALCDFPFVKVEVEKICSFVPILQC